MGLFDFLRSSREDVPTPATILPNGGEPRAYDLADPAFYEFLRAELNGTTVSVDAALRNTAVFRSVNLIASAVGMLPLYVKRKGTGGTVSEALDHPLYRVLMVRPNGWQTPFAFKRLMQTWLLVHGNAYAVVVRSLGRVIGLNPVHPNRVTVTQRPDWTLSYRVNSTDGSGSREFAASDILHLTALSEDGVRGLSRVKNAADVIAAHVALKRAARRMFENGNLAGGALKHPGQISGDAYNRLKASLAERSGPEHAGRWMILEENMDALPFKNTAVDAQLVELGGSFIEEVGRIFDVPRPFLGVDDTSWGSGIEQLAIMFVRFGLAPWFTAWEDAIRLTCVDEREWGTIEAEFDEQELLRGTMADQAEFFAKALGSGGFRGWKTPNEVRRQVGDGPVADGDGLNAVSSNQPANTDKPNVSSPSA